VCIANYNGEHLLADCIDSILTQRGNILCEIIVHDDASTDGSLDLLSSRYPQVLVIPSESNVGFCIANNRMVDKASGRYVLLLNNDAALFPDALMVLSTHAEALGTPAILTMPQYEWISGDLVDRGCLLDPFYNPVPNLDASRQDVAYGIGACLWVPRDVWSALGGFPEWMESIGEDLYLCCCAHLQNIPIQVTTSSGYRHRQGASFGGNRVEQGNLNTTYRRRMLSERNKTCVLFICTPTLAVWPLLGLHLALLILEGAALSLAKWSPHIWTRIYMAALGDAIRFRKNLRDCRSNQQRRASTSLGSYLRIFVPYPQKIRLLLRYGLPNLK